MKKLLIVLFSGVLAAPLGLVRATPVTNSTGLAAPISTITFDEHVYAPFTDITDQYLPEGVTFTPLVSYDYQFCGSFPGIQGHCVGSFGQTAYSIHFTTPQSGAAFAIATNPTTTTFTAKLNGAVVESYQSATDNSQPSISFQGFEGIEFDEIEISVAGPVNNRGSVIDNIQMAGPPSPPPVPGNSVAVPVNPVWAIATLILLVMSSGFVAVNRRKR